MEVRAERRHVRNFEGDSVLFWKSFSFGFDDNLYFFFRGFMYTYEEVLFAILFILFEFILLRDFILSAVEFRLFFEFVWKRFFIGNNSFLLLIFLIFLYKAILLFLSLFTFLLKKSLLSLFSLSFLYSSLFSLLLFLNSSSSLIVKFCIDLSINNY